VEQTLVKKGAEVCRAFGLIAEESSGDQEKIDQEVQGDRGKGPGVASRRAILQAKKSVG
jgi:hypothetical protein